MLPSGWQVRALADILDLILTPTSGWQVRALADIYVVSARDLPVEFAARQV